MSRRVIHRWGSLALLLNLGVLGCGAPAATVAPPRDPSEAPPPQEKQTLLQKAEAAIIRGEWARAQTHLQSVKGKDEAEATHRLAELFVLTGRYDEAVETVDQKKTARADLIIAGAYRRQGKLAEAKARLTESRKFEIPDEFSRKVALGEILIEEGKREKAEALLMQIIEGANDGRLEKLSEKERARAWGMVGRAAHLLRSPEDANDAFNESESLATADLDLLLFRADLFLEKFDFAHAEEVFKEAAKLSPHHPDVLLLRARLAIQAGLAFAEAEELAQATLKTNPKSTRARFILAGVALRDLNISEADKHVAAGLSHNPRDLPLLSMKATVRFLAEDPQGFEQTIDRVLELSPGYSDVFRVVGEYAEWEHRYPDIEKLMRRAVRLDREDGRARSLLGLTLVRSGSDAAGLVELRRAFELDPYNVRVLNTLNLYEKTIPEEYVEERKGDFHYRFPKDEAPLLRRYVPDLLEHAHAQMVERYNYTPQAPIGIEIYQSRDQFAVRTSGLPQTAIAGVCFGRKLATMSPLGSPGNLGMTLWHELAHVFHIGLSENRVPRWLTEGLAEWETERRDVGWSREMDLELYRALEADELPSLGSMSRAFTHARRMQDVANAYYASGQIAGWIVDTHGEEMAQKLVAEFGKKKLPPEVVPPLLGASFENLDKQFRSHIDKKLQRFEKQFVSVEPLLDRDEVEAALKKNPKDFQRRYHRGLLLLADGKVKKADATFAALLKEKFDPQVAFSRARLLLAKEKKKEALDLLERITKERGDGFEVRMVLGRLALAEAAKSKAVSHLRRAVEFDPFAAEPWSMLAALHHQMGDKEKELEAVRNWAKLSEHDAIVHRRFVALLLEMEKFEEARRAGELAVWSDLAGFETHRLHGVALARSGDMKAAEFEFESALLCPASPDDIQKLSTTWSEELTRIGRAAQAAQIPERIAKSPTFAVRAAPQVE